MPIFDDSKTCISAMIFTKLKNGEIIALSNVELIDETINGLDFNASSFMYLYASDSSFKNCNLSDSNLSNANFSKISFQKYIIQ